MVRVFESAQGLQTVTWQPVTQADTCEPQAVHEALPFTLSDVDQANAAAARYYIDQHVKRLNALGARKELKR